MRMLFLVLLFTFCASEIPPQWGKYGEYPCTYKSVEVGGYVAGGSQNAILLYPTVAIQNKTTLPFVAFAHGMTVGGNNTYTTYVNVLQEVCSHGYIIAAAQSCPHVYCQTFYQDVITTITTMSAKTTAIDPALQYADFTKTAVYGHSMGGAATVHVSDSENLNLTCSVAMHPSLAQEQNQNTSMDVVIPMIWFIGEEDNSVTPSIVYNGFKQDEIVAKIYADLTQASHMSMIDGEAKYIGPYFDCMIKGDTDACSYFFLENGANNICTGGFQMTQCLICLNDSATDCYN